MPASEPAQPVHEGKVYCRVYHSAGGECDRCHAPIPPGHAFNSSGGGEWSRPAESRLCLPCGWVLALDAEPAR